MGTIVQQIKEGKARKVRDNVYEVTTRQYQTIKVQWDESKEAVTAVLSDRLTANLGDLLRNANLV